jgi:5'-nucleotidase
MKPNKKQILLTNDDGIDSPGLWAAAEALSALGYVTVAAPQEQQSGTGRSFPIYSKGTIKVQTLKVNGQEWTVYAVGGTPAQTVQHSLLEILPQKPDLVVSGINYGENIGEIIHFSGTVGAALEAASANIPAIAASLQLQDPDMYLSNSPEINFQTAAYFTQFFARLLLEKRFPEEAQVLNINVPSMATPETDWQITRLSLHRVYRPVLRRQGSWEDKGEIGGEFTAIDFATLPPDSDAHVLYANHMVSVTPLTLDLTARVDLEKLENDLRQ